MITIMPGSTLYDSYINSDIFCILGSCVGIIIKDKNYIGITHGRFPEEIDTQIKKMLGNFDDYDFIYLAGGMSNSGKSSFLVYKENIKKAKDNLVGYKFKDLTGKPISIRLKNNILSFKWNSDVYEQINLN